MIRPLGKDDAPACDAIVAGLPGWFGNAEGVRDCAHAVRTQEGLVDERAGHIRGFLTIRRTYRATAEITWMAVDVRDRAGGAGTELLRALADRLRPDGVRLLAVKTLSDRQDPGPEYAATRGFYLTRGFEPVAELDIWGPDNPCQLLVKVL